MSNIYNELLPNIVSYWDFRSGGINDRIGSNHLSFNSTPVFQNKNGLSLDGTDDYVTETIANYQSSDSTGSVVALVKTEDVSVSQTIFHSGDTATNNYYTRLTLDTLGRINWAQKNNDTADEIRGQTDISGNEYRLVTLTSSGTAYTIYLDNASETISVDGGSNSGDWFADTDNRDNINIGVQKNSTVNWYWNGNIKFVMLLDKALTGQEVAELYEASKQEYGNKEQKQNFFLPESVDNSDSSLVAGYNMESVAGKVQDVTGTYPGTIGGKVTQTKGIFGNGVQFTGTDGDEIDAGATDFVSTGNITVSGLIFLDSFGGGNDGHLLHNGKTIMTINNSGIIRVSSDGGGNYAESNGVVALGEWKHLVVTRTSAGVVTHYLDSVSVSNTTDSGTPVAGNQNVRMGNNSAGTRAFDGIIDNFRVYNEIKDATWVTNDYAKFAETLNFRDSLKDATVSRANVTAGQLENTDWQVDSGAWQVKYDSSEDFRYYSCETLGIIYMPSDWVYGTVEFKLKKTETTVPRILFVADVIGSEGATGQDSYQIVIQADESIFLRKSINGTDTSIANTAASTATVDTWQTYKITRRYDGQFNVYLDEVNIISNQTENTTTASKYFLLDLDAGDQVTDIIQYRGII